MALSLPGVLDNTIFTRRMKLAESLFIKAMHPKTEIRPRRDAIEKILRLGWVGQLKIHGHRAQIHIPASQHSPLLVYNRQGLLHRKDLTTPMVKELRRLFQPKEDWTVIDAEWIKSKDKLYIFDVLKQDGQLLKGMNYQQRYLNLPRDFISPHVVLLPILESVEQCMAALEKEDLEEEVEGLVFKSLKSPGFSDTSIIRCRKSPKY